MPQFGCPVCDGSALLSELGLACAECDWSWPISQGIIGARPSRVDGSVGSPGDEFQRMAEIPEEEWADGFLAFQASDPVRGRTVFRAAFDPRSGSGSLFLPPAPSTPSARALEMSFGLAGGPASLAQAFPEVVSLGFSLPHLAFTRRVTGFLGLGNITYLLLGPDLMFPLSSGQFDVAVLNGVLDLIPGLNGQASRTRQLSLLKEFARVLKPDGMLLLGAGNRLGYSRLKDLIAGWRPGKANRKANKGDPIQTPGWYSGPGYRRLLKEAGFQAIRTLPVAPDHSFPARVHDPSQAGRGFRSRQGKPGLMARIKGSRPFLENLSNSFYFTASRSNKHPGTLMEEVRRKLAGLPGVGEIHTANFSSSVAGSVVKLAGDSGEYFLRMGQFPDQKARLRRNAEALKILDEQRIDPEPRARRWFPRLRFQEEWGPWFMTLEDGLPGIPCATVMAGDSRGEILGKLSDFLVGLGLQTLSHSEGVATLEESLSLKLRDLQGCLVDEGLREKMGKFGAGLLEEVHDEVGVTVWTHGDFNLGNCLWDSDRREISGVIDWDQFAKAAAPGSDIISLLLKLRGFEGTSFHGQRLLALLNTPWTAEEESLWGDYHSAMGVSPVKRSVVIQAGWINSLWNGISQSSRRLDGPLIRWDVAAVLDGVSG